MKKLLALTTPAAAYLTIASSAFAAPMTGQTLCPGGSSNFFSLCNVTISKVIGPLINLIFVVAVIAALLYLVYGGFRWLTSGGDKSAVAAAREHIVAAIVGLVIIFLSYFVLQIVISFFVPDFSFTNFSLPQILP